MVFCPCFFLVYVDDILKLLQTNGLGCYICGRYYVVALMYADDLILISVSLYDIQRMIDLCASVLHS